MAQDPSGAHTPEKEKLLDESNTSAAAVAGVA
jgi:hypothetical protein